MRLRGVEQELKSGKILRLMEQEGLFYVEICDSGGIYREHYISGSCLLTGLSIINDRFVLTTDTIWGQLFGRWWDLRLKRGGQEANWGLITEWIRHQGAIECRYQSGMYVLALASALPIPENTVAYLYGKSLGLAMAKVNTHIGEITGWQDQA